MLKKLVTGVVAIATVFGAFAFVVAVPAQAADSMMTTTTTTMTSSSMSFNTNLTVGSRGADVTALQSILISKGYLAIAAPTGYFGGLTRSALARWQASVGIAPAVGFFGPITRAFVNSMSGGSMGGGTGTPSLCPAGYTVVPQQPAGFTCVVSTTGGTTGGITTHGVEGTINVEKETAGVKTTAYEGDSMIALLGVRIEAKTSDMSVSRVRVNLGTTTDSYNKIFRKIYLTDSNGAVLASTDLNSQSVTRVSGTTPTYYVTLAGFNYVIAKDDKKSLYVKFDLYPSISSTYTAGTKTLSFYQFDAIRAVDGAGIDQYSSGADSITQVFSISTNLSDSATLTVSTDPGVRKATTIVADQGANNNEKDMETIGSFRVLAEKDSVLLRDLSVVVASSSVATTQLQTLYLFDGSSQVGTASSLNGTFSFTSINQTVDKDVYKTYVLKADFRSAGTTAVTYTVGAVSVTSAESSKTGRTVAVSTLSSGAGETMSVVSKGVISTLASNPISITKDGTDPATGYHLTATFNLNLKAVGADATFATTSSAFAFTILKNGSALTVPATSTTSYYPGTQPTGVTQYLANSGGFVLPRNAEITVPVTLKLDANNASDIASYFTSGNFSVKLSSISYISGGTTVNGVNTGGVAVTNSYVTNTNFTTAEVQRP